MKKIMTSVCSLLLAATIANAADTKETKSWNESCTETDRVAKMVFGSAFLGLPLGPAGAIVGFAAASFSHDYGCELNEFAKPIVETKEDVVVVEPLVKKVNVEQFALFEKNSSKISFIDDKIVNLDDDTIKSILVVGHASTPGSETYNETLGLKRAITVANVIKKIVSENKVGLTTEGEKQATFGTDRENQRVQIIVEYK